MSLPRDVMASFCLLPFQVTARQQRQQNLQIRYKPRVTTVQNALHAHRQRQAFVSPITELRQEPTCNSVIRKQALPF
jgi:hypothetical protein